MAVALRGTASLTLEVRATEAAQLSDLLRLTDAITLREGVDLSGNGGALSLHFVTSTAPASAQNALYQNTPNPVVDATQITFELAVAGPATLTVQDAAGRLVTTRKIDAVAGLNQVELDNIGATGVLTYTLTSGAFRATKKMVVVR